MPPNIGDCFLPSMEASGKNYDHYQGTLALLQPSNLALKCGQDANKNNACRAFTLLFSVGRERV
jgi:hypothetical protein